MASSETDALGPSTADHQGSFFFLRQEYRFFFFIGHQQRKAGEVALALCRASGCDGVLPIARGWQDHGSLAQTGKAIG